MKVKDNSADKGKVRRAKMSELGVFVWTCITEYTSPQQMLHPASEFPALIGMSERTFARRLENDDWVEIELFRICNVTKSKRLVDFMVKRYSSVIVVPEF